MTFESDKRVFLKREDKSLKGSVDKKISSLVNVINKLGSYYTTSSCSGRIVLIIYDDSGRKDKSRWLFVGHGKVTLEKISHSLGKLPEEKAWLKMESMIVHVACRDLKSAVKLLNCAKRCGLKRSGIISVKKNKVVLEIMSSEHLEILISEKKKLLVDNSYLKKTLSEMNKKLESNWKRISRVRREIKKYF